jgi:hypothetical protein
MLSYLSIIVFIGFTIGVEYILSYKIISKNDKEGVVTEIIGFQKKK